MSWLATPQDHKPECNCNCETACQVPSQQEKCLHICPRWFYPFLSDMPFCPCLSFPLAWEFGIENGGIFSEFFWSPFPTKGSMKTNSGRKFEKFGELSFCTSSDLSLCLPSSPLTVGNGKKVVTKGVSSLEKCLEVGILLCFSNSGGSLETQNL